jgi:hypothetical protein
MVSVTPHWFTETEWAGSSRLEPGSDGTLHVTRELRQHMVSCPPPEGVYVVYPPASTTWRLGFA